MCLCFDVNAFILKFILLKNVLFNPPVVLESRKGGRKKEGKEGRMKERREEGRKEGKWEGRKGGRKEGG